MTCPSILIGKIYLYVYRDVRYPINIHSLFLVIPLIMMGFTHTQTHLHFATSASEGKPVSLVKFQLLKTIVFE